jgi:hypothetical protein
MGYGEEQLTAIRAIETVYFLVSLGMNRAPQYNHHYWISGDRFEVSSNAIPRVLAIQQ